MRKVVKIIGLLAVITSLVLASIPQSPTLAQDYEERSKVTALLSLQVEAKIRWLEGDRPEENEVSPIRDEGIQSLSSQKVFIHLSEAPGEAELTELEKMGITAYPDSWIPPVRNHPAGLLLADMPLDKLDDLANKDWVVKLDTAEQVLEAQNDLGAIKINADDVWNLGYDGSGVRVAVLDSGLDINHPDIPAPVASKDYSNWPALDDTIANDYTGHGTHVTGTALGTGIQSAGKYKGIAAGADLIFLKIGKDGTKSATYDAMTNALTDAADIYNADIITMSYGGWDSYHDGSSQTSQAVDYAFSQDAVVFISAGNEGNDEHHYSGVVPSATISAVGELTPGTSNFIQVNVIDTHPDTTALAFNLVWYDGLGVNNNLDLEYFDATFTAMAPITYAPADMGQEESSRGTERQLSYYDLFIPDGTYYLRVLNHSAVAQGFHIYYVGSLNKKGHGSVTFQNPDSNYTIASPADADDAIAVGSYTTRKQWTDYQGNGWQYVGEVVDTVSTFSSRGPRVDSVQKPNIVAPGCAIISCRDQDVYPWPNPDYDAQIIDNDGINDGNGPADYYVMQGTSMASPMAAGACALLLQSHPSLKGDPSAVKDWLQTTASKADSPDSTWGYGLIDIFAAIDAAPGEGVLVQRGCAQYGNGEHVTFVQTFTTTPVVVTSSQYGGEPKISFAKNNVVSGFDLVLTDNTGSAVSNAWVQWIAVGTGTPDNSITIKSECALHGDGSHITFFPAFSGTPAIVTSAQHAWEPKISCAMNNAVSGFDLALTDNAGYSVSDAWVQTIAVGSGTLDPAVTIQKGSGLGNNGDHINFPTPFASAPVIITNAYDGVNPLISCAVNNAADGFDLALTDNAGNPVSGRIQWIAVSFTGTRVPSITIDPSSGPPGTLVTVNGSGFSADETGITVTWDGASVVTGITANNSGAWHTEFQVPLDAALGNHVIDAYGDLTAGYDVPDQIFTVESAPNNPPNTPSDPSPANDAADASIYADLSWTGGDPDAGDMVTYDVYFGTSETPPVVSEGQTGTTYDPGTLSYNTKYYWKIVATDNHAASTEGPVWEFTTVSQPGDEDNPNAAEGLASLEDKLVVAYSYKAGEGGWTWYNPDWVPAANTLTTLYAGRGYWINVSEACNLVYGTNTYELDADWNLIAWLGW